MGRRILATVDVLLVSVLALGVVVQTANAALTIEHVTAWFWSYNTEVKSVARGDVDGDSDIEIVSGGYYNDGTRDVAQLCVWDGATFALENVRCWYWAGNTYIRSVAIGDVDGKGQTEIVTGGYFNDGTRDVAQLCVWNAASLEVENVKTWYWYSSTCINSVAVGDVDNDGAIEIVTGGSCINSAQLCVWSGVALELEHVTVWYWDASTIIESVAVGDVDGDGAVEIVTGGWYWNFAPDVSAMLCVWSGVSLTLENVKTWTWVAGTKTYSVAIDDVDADGSNEIVTGGKYYDSYGAFNIAQLCVWSGSNLALENVQVWFWTSETIVDSVGVGDVDGDSALEIITGGHYEYYAQLCVWSGSTLTLENVQTWKWAGDTYVISVTVGDVDGDGNVEMVTGGRYWDYSRINAQLCVWS